ncbi:putative membrane protein [Deinobacterium chartae]|uniref:Putative membrane protein n=1 Tax=Deinobacterium chartae TaxID=521158 RepID=A0A841HZ61_9DEIO|nr:DUF2306 domain-containing protein [Deinobacterium chartae]MBB6098687.1 putative membrane protein [Deinobacterium chartae]
MHLVLLLLHVGGAVAALVAAASALRAQPGSLTHRRAGRVYVISWVILTVAGFILGAADPDISSFEVLNALGMACVVIAMTAIWFKRRLGRAWLKTHYGWMLNSTAFLVIATLNQVLPRVGLSYPDWVFWLMVAAPFFVLPGVIARYDARYSPPKRSRARG